MARAIRAGQVHVNTAFPFSVTGAPLGGVKSSDSGPMMGADAVLDHTQVKTITIDASS